ncbi:uncharacterized protein KY384_004290 [Bacidia gigantensis]|uniref:uncharacterized protein n=1 Tax=Bacidia gigantensis TaxID=2732470 RepID=UPI001D056839|nr:uncharacterized protein KY384_004290 [Bacidia gigantensis]KAG8530933.1 hypothetical protein KY384_004290 [Bacidia gigantensis]
MMRKIVNPSSINNLESPRLTLTIYFALWKALLLTLVLLSPGPGYDVSTHLLPNFEPVDAASSVLRRAQHHLASRLIRWDAIYFSQIARRGYVFEQEWAFGWGHTRLLAFVGHWVAGSREVAGVEDVVLAGMVLAHLFHWMSVIVLYDLTLEVWKAKKRQKVVTFAFLCAALHIVSPAGVFLSAPYAESTFSLLNFVGCYLYAKALRRQSKDAEVVAAGLLLLSGVVCGVATTFRGNGLLSGLLFVLGAGKEVAHFLVNVKNRARRDALLAFRRLLYFGLSGALMACTAFWPQYFAFQHICVDLHDGKGRPWCYSYLPSVYSWVQQEYWGVGFLRYWTMSNIPLFMLAAPMLVIMISSSIWAWIEGSSRNGNLIRYGDVPPMTVVLHLAMPQLVLCLLALTTYHVQIITRLSSGYPIWYWWLAVLVVRHPEMATLGTRFKVSKGILRWMVLYGIIQAGFYASFLPPA